MSAFDDHNRDKWIAYYWRMRPGMAPGQVYQCVERHLQEASRCGPDFTGDKGFEEFKASVLKAHEEETFNVPDWMAEQALNVGGVMMASFLANIFGAPWTTIAGAVLVGASAACADNLLGHQACAIIMAMSGVLHVGSRGPGATK